MQPYTDADVLDLQDVIADARIRGIGNGTYSMARAILEAGYRPSQARADARRVAIAGNACCGGNGVEASCEVCRRD